MELWQRQGFASFGDWRRASEKARRAAKKQAVAPAAAITTAVEPLINATAAAPPPDAAPLEWQPLQLLDDAGRERSRRRPSDVIVDHELPGDLHEHVQVTPGGRRAHNFKHTSPGGTTRFEEYVSPAGTRSTNEERLAWRQRMTAQRRRAEAMRVGRPFAGLTPSGMSRWRFRDAHGRFCYSFNAGKSYT